MGCSVGWGGVGVGGGWGGVGWGGVGWVGGWEGGWGGVGGGGGWGGGGGGVLYVYVVMGVAGACHNTNDQTVDHEKEGEGAGDFTVPLLTTNHVKRHIGEGELEILSFVQF